MGNGAARFGDVAGGAITATAAKTFINGKKVALVGDGVAGHGDSPHSSPTMATGATTIRV